MKKNFDREFWFHGAVLTLLPLILAVLMNISWGELPSEVVVGQIAAQDIRADKDYVILDAEETAKRQEELQGKAAQEIEPVTIQVKAGQSIIRSGDPFNERAV